jgi:DNA-binding transcriptional ArsR family regulator
MKQISHQQDPELEQDRVFESAAELFSILSTPVRLKIISAVCQEEKNVSELLDLIDTTQPNMSQHLGTLYRSGILAKRREGTQIYYRLQSERVATLCRAVCTQVAIELDSVGAIEQSERLLPSAHR